MTSKEEYKEYNIKFKEFLKELPVQPSKVEFSKIKEQDQIEQYNKEPDLYDPCKIDLYET